MAFGSQTSRPQSAFSTPDRNAPSGQNKLPISTAPGFTMKGSVLENKPREEWTEMDCAIRKAEVRQQVIKRFEDNGIKGIRLKDLLSGSDSQTETMTKSQLSQMFAHKAVFFKKQDWKQKKKDEESWEVSDEDAKAFQSTGTPDKKGGANRASNEKKPDNRPAKPFSNNGLQTTLMGFGKHAARTIQWVKENDPQYFRWAYGEIAWFKQKVDKVDV